MDTYRTAVGLKSSLFLQRCSMQMESVPTRYSGVICPYGTSRGAKR